MMKVLITGAAGNGVNLSLSTNQHLLSEINRRIRRRPQSNRMIYITFCGLLRILRLKLSSFDPPAVINASESQSVGLTVCNVTETLKLTPFGAAGFLGQGITEELKNKAELRLLDIVPVEMKEAVCIRGSVESPEDCSRAMEGADALVIAHMLSRTEDRAVYDDPSTPFNVNKNQVFTRDMPPCASSDIYALTKVCQEHIADFYHMKYGIDIAVLRVGGIYKVDDNTKVVSGKYGNVLDRFFHPVVERRDIGTAVWAAL